MPEKRLKLVFQKNVTDAHAYFAKWLPTAHQWNFHIVFLKRPIEHLDLLPDAAFINVSKIRTALDDRTGEGFRGVEQSAPLGIDNGCIENDRRIALNVLQQGIEPGICLQRLLDGIANLLWIIQVNA